LNKQPTTHFHHLVENRATIAFELDGNRDASTRTVAVGLAIANPKDKPSRARGREIALGRLKKRPLKLSVTIAPEGGGVLYQVLNALRAAFPAIRSTPAERVHTD
jgi:hypothetical protein